jgi:hypothetical protein
LRSRTAISTSIGRHVVRVEARLHDRIQPVEIDEQVMRVSGQQQVGRAGELQGEAVAAVAVHDRDHEIGSLRPQRLGLLLSWCRWWTESADPPGRTTRAEFW